MQPRHQHDCDNCKFLGHAGESDLYICSKTPVSRSELVARHSSDDPDYSSTMLDLIFEPTVPTFHKLSLELDWAYKLAQTQGYFTPVITFRKGKAT